MNHTILAPHLHAATRLSTAIRSRGHVARHTTYVTPAGVRHVVLAIAPMGVIERACQAESFAPGLAVGFNRR